MIKRFLPLSAFVPCLSTLALSLILVSGAVPARMSAQSAHADVGPVCTKCNAGPQSGVPTRTIVIHVVYNNHPVKNAKVTVVDPTGVTPTSTYTTGSTGVVQAVAPLGSYRVTAQKNTYVGSTNLAVPSGMGSLQMSISVAAAN